MTLSDNIVVNTFSIIIMMIVVLYYEKNGDKGEKHTRLFMTMIRLVILLFIAEIMGRFDGQPETIYPIINQVGNFLLFFLAPVIPSLWFLYLHNYIFPDKKLGKGLAGTLMGVNFINILMLLGTQIFGWYYAIDAANHYIRGPYYMISPVLTVIPLVGVTLYVIYYKRKVERTHFIPLLLFPITPLVGILLQALIFGYPFALMGLVFSVLLIAFFAQSIETNVDYLSGAYNRKRLETYLHKKIAASTRTNTFSAIMADVNGLKEINDMYGHTVGDEALVTISSLVRTILRSNDFVARYGGDEFCILLDTASEETLETVVHKINRQLDTYNEMSLKPYKLGLSMGYAVYDPDSGMNAKEFYNQIDKMMYEDKKRHHISLLKQD